MVEAVSPRRDWESVLATWAAGPSDTEKQKCENAVRAVKAAIAGSNRLAHRSVRTFVQGSYRNRTNVRQDSDVDVGVLCSDTFFWGSDGQVEPEEWGYVPATYQYATFKDEVQIALESHFGPDAVNRGNKAFDVNENTYRVDADVVPCFPYHYYFRVAGGGWDKVVGVGLQADNDAKIHSSFPEQHYENGVAKNEATARRFKKLVRIVKRLANEMSEAGIGAADAVPSFLIECLVWNAPNEAFSTGTFKGDLRYVLAFLWNNTRKNEDCATWTEVNNIKYVFHPSQPLSRDDVHAFLDAAWNYVGFE